MKWKPLIAATVILVIGFSAWGEEDTLCPRCLRGTTIGAGVSDSIEVGGGVSDEQLCVRCLRGSGGAMPTPIVPTSGPCCVSHAGPGCDQDSNLDPIDSACQDAVCIIEPTCCNGICLDPVVNAGNACFVNSECDDVGGDGVCSGFGWTSDSGCVWIAECTPECAIALCTPCPIPE